MLFLLFVFVLPLLFAAGFVVASLRGTDEHVKFYLICMMNIFIAALVAAILFG